MRNNGIFGACDDFPADNITPVRPVNPRPGRVPSEGTTPWVPVGSSRPVPRVPITDFYPVSGGGSARVPAVNITPVERVPETARPIGMTATTGIVVGMTAGGGGRPIGMTTGGGAQVGMTAGGGGGGRTPWIVPNLTRPQVQSINRGLRGYGASPDGLGAYYYL